MAIALASFGSVGWAHADPTYLNAFGSAGTASGQVQFPYSVSIAPGGNVYVTDRLQPPAVHVFSPTGTFLTRINNGVGTLLQGSEFAGTAITPAGVGYVVNDAPTYKVLDLLDQLKHLDRFLDVRGCGDRSVQRPDRRCAESDR
jgi:hypothetical protein